MSAARRRAGGRLGLALPLLLALGLAAVAADAAPDTQGLQPTPKLTARVTDLTGTLTAEQQTALEQKLAAFEAAKGSQLAVLMVPTTQPEDIFQYSFRVAEQWKLGRATVGGQRVDDGALLVIAKNDRRVWIQVGYGPGGRSHRRHLPAHRRRDASLRSSAREISTAVSTPASTA